MKQSGFPKGWDEDHAKRVLDHYENQTENSDSRFNEFIPSRPLIGLGFFSCFE